MRLWLTLLLFFQKALIGVGAETQWQMQRKLAAPEAHQAASADQNFVYAITNGVIAKYDRKNGKRVATSSGAAKHLNSGFFWKGKLLCAHSNYPLKPERSEIKVLDIDSMQLTTFKDLGSAGGSLTWVMHKDGFWWCNFALYGTDNYKTFLVKYDEQWRELARWTYPAKVINQLGRHSLSGGIWRGEQLWTTGHDNKVRWLKPSCDFIQPAKPAWDPGDGCFRVAALL